MDSHWRALQGCCAKTWDMVGPGMKNRRRQSVEGVHEAIAEWLMILPGSIVPWSVVGRASAGVAGGNSLAARRAIEFLEDKDLGEEPLFLKLAVDGDYDRLIRLVADNGGAVRRHRPGLTSSKSMSNEPRAGYLFDRVVFVRRCRTP